VGRNRASEATTRDGDPRRPQARYQEEKSPGHRERDRTDADFETRRRLSRTRTGELPQPARTRAGLTCSGSWQPNQRRDLIDRDKKRVRTGEVIAATALDGQQQRGEGDRPEVDNPPGGMENDGERFRHQADHFRRRTEPPARQW
jgi:hypothetical protein